MEQEEEEQPSERRRRAKRYNERLKLLASFLNGTAIATIVAGLILPVTESADRLEPVNALITLLVGLVLHIFGQLSLSAWKPEE